MDFSGGANGKESTCQCRRCNRLRFDPWVGKILWRRNRTPLQYSCLENSMDRGPWQAIVHGATKSWTQLKQLSAPTHMNLNSWIFKRYQLFLGLEPVWPSTGTKPSALLGFLLAHSPCRSWDMTAYIIM